jgi:hypothetical protein
MRLVVTFANGTWEFVVSSDDGAGDYVDNFEITDLDEAKAVAADLMIELSKEVDDDHDPIADFLGDDTK